MGIFVLHNFIGFLFYIFLYFFTKHCSYGPCWRFEIVFLGHGKIYFDLKSQ